MKDKYLERTKGLIKEEGINLIKNKRIALFGLGGVGGTALIALARLGFSHFLIIDYDVVAPSNLNRQLLYFEKDVGKSKVECARNHLLNTDDSIDVISINTKVDENIESLLKDYQIDFIVDAIDDVKGKVYLAKYATTYNIPIVISLGMANRLDPSKVTIERLDKTTMDPLARKARYEFKKEGIDTKKIYATLSKEEAIKDGANLNSIVLVPSASGLLIAHFVFSYFFNKK